MTASPERDSREFAARTNNSRCGADKIAARREAIDDSDRDDVLPTCVAKVEAAVSEAPSSGNGVRTRIDSPKMEASVAGGGGLARLIF